MKTTLAILPLACVALLLTAGCSTVENNHRQKVPLMTAYVAGDQTTALAEAKDKLKPPSAFNTSRVGTGDELVWRVEEATLEFVFGRFADAVRDYGLAERVIADYDARATVNARQVGSETAGALSNQNALPYRGWCRDRMGIEIYKSLAYLGEGREDAFRAQVKRLRERQREIQEEYAKVFESEQAEVAKARESNPAVAKQADEQGSLAAITGNAQNADFARSLQDMKAIASRGYGAFLNPLGLYLSALGNWRDGNWDNAAIDTQRLRTALPNNPFVAALHATVLRNAGKAVPADLAAVASLPYPIDRNCVYVIFANGRGASFRQCAVHWPIMTSWPMCEFYATPYANAIVAAGGQHISTVPFADMDAILAQEFDERLPGIITRTVISTLIKEATYRAAQIAAYKSSNNAAVQLASLAAVTVAGSAYRYAMNTADTRCWETLPKEFQLAQIPLPADRTVTVSLPAGPTIPVSIPAGARSAIVFVNAPSPQNVRCCVLPFTSK